MSHTYPLIQIVDDNDRVIGAMPMEEAKQQGKIHRIARVIAEDEKGRILAQKRSSSVIFPNRWDSSSAGHVDEGETYEAAAIRETSEEIGVENISLKPLGKYYYTEKDLKNREIKQFNSVFKIKLDFTPTNLNEDEVSEVRWFTLEEIKNRIKEKSQDFTPGFTKVIEEFYKD